MIPTFTFFGKTFSIYMIMALAGVLTVLFALYRTAKKNGLDEIEMLWMTALSFGASAIGGSLLYGLTNIKLLIELFQNLDRLASFGQFVEILGIIFGGSVFYGGLIGILLATLIYRRKRRLSARYLDLAFVGVPMFHVFGRIGCFLSGCCFGVESRFGFVYHHSLIEQANGVRRLPVQLFEAAFNAALCLILYRLFCRKRLQGWLIHVYLYAYPVFRFCIEFFRGDSYRGYLWGLSTSQWISLLLLLGNSVALAWRLRRCTAACA